MSVSLGALRASGTAMRVTTKTRFTQRAASGSMDHAEGSDDRRATAIAWRKDLDEHAQRLVFGTAIGIDQCTRSRTEPRAPDGVSDQADDDVFERPWCAHLDRRTLREEHARDLGEVVHVGTEHDRTAVHGRLED